MPSKIWRYANLKIQLRHCICTHFQLTEFLEGLFRMENYHLCRSLLRNPCVFVNFEIYMPNLHSHRWQASLNQKVFRIKNIGISLKHELNLARIHASPYHLASVDWCHRSIWQWLLYCICLFVNLLCNNVFPMFLSLIGL